MKMATDESTSSPLREIFQQDERVPLNKVTRPLMTGVVHRERLFSRIDEARMRPVLWVAAPGGSGKTTLVASYIESRSLPYLWYQVDSGDTDIATFFHFMEIAANKAMPEPGQPLLRLTPDQFLALQTFSRRWFETLFARLSRPCTVVFDNFQDATGTLFHDVLYEGLDALPPGITVIVVSREVPPARFARLQANGRIELLGWEQVRFTLDEAMEFVRARSAEEVSAETIQYLYHKTEGWVAGLLLIMEHAKLQGSELLMEGCWTTEGIFNYFAAEVLARMNQESQAFLLATSLLPYIPVSLADSLTGYDRAGRILAEMSRSNYFTSRRTAKEAIYQYHQLFQAFLQSQAEEQFGPEDIRRLRSNAAMLFAEAGDPAAAVVLYKKAEKWQEAVALVCEHAPGFLAQGRSETVLEWLAGLPQAVMDTAPWLLFWKGVCLMSVHVAESRACFRRAFDIFSSIGERSGMFSSWSAGANTFQFEGDYRGIRAWVSLLEEILAKSPDFPSVEIEARVTVSMFNALSIGLPDHPGIDFWEERAFSLMHLERYPDIDLRLQAGAFLVVYYLWIGNFAKASLIIDDHREMLVSQQVSDLNLLTIRNIEAFYEFMTGSCGVALMTVKDALAISDRCGIHLWDNNLIGHGLASSVSLGDRAATSEFLQAMKANRDKARMVDVGYHKLLLAWNAMRCGDLASAQHNQAYALSLLAEIGLVWGKVVSHIGMAIIHHRKGDDRECSEQLTKASMIGSEMKSRLLECMCLLVKAHISFDHGDGKEGIALLSRALLLGREGEFINIYWWLPDVMASLCARALEAGIETEYVRRLIRLRNLTEYPPSTEIEAWPWPVKVYSLGRFELQIDGEPVRFSGKVQKKPLEMLKALVALGGEEAREGQIANYLWPDADGDTARSSLKITLHRLRDLLGNDRAIQAREGRISLDQQLVWTDVRAFDQLLRSAQLKGDTGDEFEAVRLTEKALELYRGQFLDDESDKPWLVSPRKRLKSRFVLHVVAMGNLWLQRGDQKRSIACYLRGLEVDDLAEELYQNLMECYLAAGLKGEAVDTYQRCRKCLAFQGVRPSARTTAIYKTVLA